MKIINRTMAIRFNFPHQVGTELQYIQDALDHGRLAGDGPYTKKCSALLEEYLCAGRVLLTHSCTAALEMAAILANIKPGDEVIMPSYTFVSTANAFVLRGAIPVFVDIRPDTLNIDETLIQAVITQRTKAIVPVHYAGVACEMDSITAISREHNLLVVEDAAQALGSTYKGRKLGTIGDLAAFSFHETKNVVSGEGGALVINNQDFFSRAEIIREKGTNRSRFFRGEVDKYTWVDIGSSYLPSELVAAFLYAQLQHIDETNGKRMAIWNQYRSRLSALEDSGLVTLPTIPKECVHNAHMFYLLTGDHAQQVALLNLLKQRSINAVFHYVPLHSTDAGSKYCRTPLPMKLTEDLPSRLIRLPLYPALSAQEIEHVCSSIADFFRNASST